MLFSVHSFVAHSFRISRYLSIWCLVSGILEITHASTEITSISTSNGFRKVCNDCVLEAESISILTFPSATNGNGNQLTSIDATAIVTPVITVYGDGEVETSYITSVMGELDTDDPHVILRSGSFWTELGVELTSPTTYAAYLDVLVTTASLSAPTAAPEKCFTIENNIPFDASRMIIPLSGEEDTTDDNVPFALSQYFASLPQFSGINVGRCDSVGFANFSVEEKRPISQYRKPMYHSFGEKVRRQVGTTGLSNSTLSLSTETDEATPTIVTPTSLSEQNSVATSAVPPSGSVSLIAPLTGGTTSSIQVISSSAPRTVTSTQSASSSRRVTSTSTAEPARASSSTRMPDTVVDLTPTTTDATTTTVIGRRPSITSVSRPTLGIVSPLTRPPTTLASAQVLVESTSTTQRRSSSNTPMAVAQTASLPTRSTVSSPRSIRSTSSTSRSTRSPSNTSRSTRSPSNTSRSTRSPSNSSPTSISSGRTRSTARTIAAPSSTSTNAVSSLVTVTSSAIAVAAEEFNEPIILRSSQTVDRTGSILAESVAATTALPALIVGTVTFTATVNRGSTQFIVGPGNTLTPDGVVTLGETVVSLADDPTEPVAVINGETATIAEVPVLSTPRPITVADEVFTAFVTVSSTFFSFAPTVVLTAGGVVTVSETRVSLAPDATEAVIGSNTVPLADPIDESPGSSDVVEGGDDDDDGDIGGDDPATVDNGIFSGAVPKTDFSANWLVSFTICTGLIITLIL